MHSAAGSVALVACRESLELIGKDGSRVGQGRAGGGQGRG